MSFLPIMERELRVGARSPITYRNRWLVVLLVLGLTTFVYVVEMIGSGNKSRVGRNIFEATSAVLMFGAVCYGFATADALSRERREGTLGLLFLTNLRGRDVVLGKLSVSSLGAVYAIFGAMPVLSIPVLLGGVAGVNFWMMQLAIFNTIFFALSIGLFVSSLSYGLRYAMVATGCVIALITIGIPLFEHEVMGRRTPFTMIFSPIEMYDRAQQFRISPSAFWMSFSCVHGLGWLFLIGTCGVLPRNWKQTAPSARVMRWRERLQRWSLGSASARHTYRKPLLSLNPICWLDDRYRLQKSLMWGVILICGVCWMAEWASDVRGVVQEEEVVLPALGLHCVMVLWVAAQAAHRFAKDRQSGALELLLATPLTIKEIVAGRMMALRKQFMWPLLAIAGFDLLMLSALLYPGLPPWRGGAFEYYSGWVATGVAGFVMLVVGTWSMSWLSLWLGLSRRSWSWAVMEAVVRLVVVHGLCFFFSMACLVWFTRIAGFRTAWFNQTTISLLWLTLGLLISLPQALHARRQLQERFRELAARTHHTKPGWMQRCVDWLLPKTQ